MQDKLIDIKNEALAQILAAQDNSTLEEIRVEYLGKSKGKLTEIIKKLPSLPEGERAIVGRFANEVKNTIEDALQSQLELVVKQKEANIAKTEWIDVTMPADKPAEGHLHPLTTTLKLVIDTATRLGYQIARGPEIETDFYNFEAVNMPKDSPSRDTQASFYLDCRHSKISPGELLLRTQTSNMQSRILRETPPPLRVLTPGKCHRVDDVDASHNIEFWQFEGFAVDKDIRLTDLFGTVDYFLSEVLPGTKIRFAGTHFDFTEPSVEAHARCTVCQGKGCAYCKYSGWLEILGAGMIHPNLFKTAGIDPNEWTGFAFGMGLTRLALLRYQIDDIRLLTNPDLRILRQF